MLIPEEEYQRIINILPILCVDAVIINEKGEYLLVKRNNDPLKDEYWVPGGRVMHMETVENAMNRILNKEIGGGADELLFFGIYQDVFSNNSFQEEANYHTLSVVFMVKLKGKDNIKLDSQSSTYKWSKTLPKRLLKNLILR